MTTAQFDTAIDTIRNLDNVRRVSVSDDGSRVAVSVGVDYEVGCGRYRYRASSSTLFVDIIDLLAPFGFVHMDSVVDESDPGDCDAVEVWLFEHS